MKIFQPMYVKAIQWAQHKNAVGILALFFRSLYFSGASRNDVGANVFGKAKIRVLVCHC